MAFNDLIDKIKRNYPENVQKRLITLLSAATDAQPKPEDKQQEQNTRSIVERVITLDNKISAISDTISTLASFTTQMPVVDDKLSNVETKEVTKVIRKKKLLNNVQKTGLASLAFPLLIAGIAWLVEWIKKKFSEVMSDIADGVISALQGTEDFFNGTISSIAKLATSINDGIIKALNNTIVAVFDGLAKATDFILSYVPLVDKDLRASVQKSLEDAKTYASGEITQISVSIDTDIMSARDAAQASVSSASLSGQQNVASFKQSIQYETTDWANVLFGPAAAVEAPSTTGARPSMGAGPTTTPTSKPAIKGGEAAIPAGTSGSAVAGTPSMRKILDFIADKESRQYGYNALVYGKNTPKSANLTEMTLREVLEYQKGMISRGHASTAVGRYQFLRATLIGLIEQSGMSLDTKFSPEVQDKLAAMLVEQAGYSRFVSGKITLARFQNRLAGIWASLPKADGSSDYTGLAGNKIGTTSDAFQSVLNDSLTLSTQVAEAPKQEPPAPPISPAPTTVTVAKTEQPKETPRRTAGISFERHFGVGEYAGMQAST